jgi:YD repeat-containing protein
MRKLMLVVGLVLASVIAVKATGVAETKNAGEITYDAKGRPVRVTDSAGRSIGLSYCDDGRMRACDVHWSSSP